MTFAWWDGFICACTCCFILYMILDMVGSTVSLRRRQKKLRAKWDAREKQIDEDLERYRRACIDYVKSIEEQAQANRARARRMELPLN